MVTMLGFIILAGDVVNNAILLVDVALPLLVSGGAGSELYGGLGAVMIGDLPLSTVFTLVLIPVLFTLWFDMKAALVRVFERVWNGRLPAGGTG